MPIDLFPDRVIIQTAVTRVDHEKLWTWWIHGEPSRGAIVREALTWFFEVKPALDEIVETQTEIYAVLRRVWERIEKGQE